MCASKLAKGKSLNKRVYLSNGKEGIGSLIIFVRKRKNGEALFVATLPVKVSDGSANIYEPIARE